MKTKNNRAFTIIELLVVISVIAILVGIALPRFKGMQDEGNKSKAKSETKTIQTALESWFINHTPNAYPSALSELTSASPLILATALYDPFRSAGNEYAYLISPNEMYYVVSSFGPNGHPDITGIEDDGTLTGVDDDDIFATNGTGLF